jgi:23S rRNA (cytosine1962-C5)-methyltransferase
MAKLPELSLPNHLKDRLQQGHPWVYRNHLETRLPLRTGDWVKLRCGGWTGYALWDNQGAIALRVFSTRYLPDQPWFKQRLQDAWDLRASLRQRDCSAYRWVFGEGDGLPGITIDLYGEFAVIQTYMESGQTLLKGLITALPQITPLRGILWRTQHLPEEHTSEATEWGGEIPQPQDAPPEETWRKTKLLWGESPPEPGSQPVNLDANLDAATPNRLVVKEYGLQFQVNLATGQKTGLFLDHRENRHYVQSLSDGLSVLNCFAYTGAFSLYALRGGASHVTSVDIGKGLAAATQANLNLNDFAPERHQFVTADCFELLQSYVQQGRQFDLVILDPPSFAKNKQNQYAALRAYSKLNTLGLKCVKEQGLLVSASCTSQISPSAFTEMLGKAAATANRRLQLIYEAGQPVDHPVPAHFPEGRYLKFVVGKVTGTV